MLRLLRVARELTHVLISTLALSSHHPSASKEILLCNISKRSKNKTAAFSPRQSAEILPRKWPTILRNEYWSKLLESFLRRINQPSHNSQLADKTWRTDFISLEFYYFVALKWRIFAGSSSVKVNLKISFEVWKLKLARRKFSEFQNFWRILAPKRLTSDWDSILSKWSIK